MKKVLIFFEDKTIVSKEPIGLSVGVCTKLIFKYSNNEIEILMLVLNLIKIDNQLESIFK